MLRRSLACIAAATAALALGGLAGPASAAGGTVTVTENSLAATPYPATPGAGDADWYTEDTRPGGSAAFVTDFGAPAGLGTGALELSTDATNSAKVQLMNHQFLGTPLADVTALGYWTYQAAGNVPSADASYQVPVDLDGDLATTADRTVLVYEPYWNGTVVPSTWQQWDVAAGRFWSSRTAGGLVSGAGGPPFYTVSDVLTVAPGAVVLGLGVNVGSYNPSYQVAVDGVSFGTAAGTTTFDFEHYLAPTSMDQCKNGGWQSGFAPGQFRNQGDCVSFVASGGRTHPAG